MRQNPLLSCCMIVKNEEQFLKRCLESVKDFVDEIIIVDTGSQDRTVEIARAYTDKIFFHPWENDFSTHRNQSISYARGDWIFQIDADEQLAPGGGEAIRELAAASAPGVNFLMLNITDIDQQGRPRATFNFPRVFRNRVGIHYEGIVHNQVVGKGQCVACPAVIWHYGYYLDEEKMEAKRRRSIPLLLKQLEEDPENAFALYNLANMHIGIKDYGKVIDYGERALALLRRKETVPTFFISLYSPLIHAYIRENRIMEARKHAEDSIMIFPRFLDGYYLLNEIAFLQQDWETVLDSGEKALELYRELRECPSKLGSVVSFYLNSRCHLALRMGEAMMRLGRFQEAQKMLETGLEEHPSPDAAFRFILKVTQECDAKALHDHFLKRALEDCPDDILFNRLYLKKAVEKHLEVETTLGFFDKLARIDPEEDWDFRKALFLLERGRFEDAEKAFGVVIQRGSGSAQAYAYRALSREMLGDMRGSMEDHERAVFMDPGLAYSWAKLGEHSMAMGDWEKALAFLSNALEAGEKGPEVLLSMAIAAVKLGEVEISAAPLELLLEMLGLARERSLETMEDLALLFEEIGRALDQRGNPRLATEAFGMAAELDPHKAMLNLMAGRRLLAMGEREAAVLRLAVALKGAKGKEGILEEVEAILTAAGVER